jgi:hypothetical protein
MDKNEFLEQFRSQFEENSGFYNAFLTLKKIRLSLGMDIIDDFESRKFTDFCKETGIKITGAILEDNEPQKVVNESKTRSFRMQAESSGWNSLKELFDFDPSESTYKPFWDLSDPAVLLRERQVVEWKMFNRKSIPVVLFTDEVLNHIPDLDPKVRSYFRPFYVSLDDEMFMKTFRQPENEPPDGICLDCDQKGLPANPEGCCVHCGSQRIVFKHSDFQLPENILPRLKEYSKILWPAS